jgi:hypothetical protein
MIGPRSGLYPRRACNDALRGSHSDGYHFGCLDGIGHAPGQATSPRLGVISWTLSDAQALPNDRRSRAVGIDRPTPTCLWEKRTRTLLLFFPRADEFGQGMMRSPVFTS